MKFAKTLTSIASQLPEEYLYYTIDYKTFKKLLNRVVKELETQGLSETLLHQIHLKPNQSSSTPIPSTKLSYVLSPVSSNEASESTSEISSEFHPFLLKTEEEKTEKNTIDFVPKPYLWLFIDDDSEVPHLHEPSDVDEPLQLSTALDFGCPPNSSIAECPAEKPDDLPSNPPTSEICYPNPSIPGQMICSTDDAGTTRRRLLYHLPSDAQFFSLLTISLAKLHDYQTLILKKRFELEIERLLEVLGSITSAHSEDLYVWRSILHHYLESEIFVGSNCSAKTIEQSRELLMEWEKNVFSLAGNLPTEENTPPQPLSTEKSGKKWRKVAAKWFEAIRNYSTTEPANGHQPGFKDRRSWEVLNRFMKFNQDVLALKQFVELNTTAVYKILKKHDKKTGLSARPEWDRIMKCSPLSEVGWERRLVWEIGNKLQTVTPHINSYTCPVCFSLLYPPIRLPCSHMFCRSCIYAMVNKSISAEHRRLPPTLIPSHVCKNMRCPLCREEVNLHIKNLFKIDGFRDKSIEKFIRLWFPRECKKLEKQWERECAEKEIQILRWQLGGRI